MKNDYKRSIRLVKNMYREVLRLKETLLEKSETDSDEELSVGTVFIFI